MSSLCSEEALLTREQQERCREHPYVCRGLPVVTVGRAQAGTPREGSCGRAARRTSRAPQWPGSVLVLQSLHVGPCLGVQVAHVRSVFPPLRDTDVLEECGQVTFAGFSGICWGFWVIRPRSELSGRAVTQGMCLFLAPPPHPHVRARQLKVCPAHAPSR